MFQRDEAAEHQAGAGEQHEGQSHFQHHRRVAQQASAAEACGASGTAQHLHHVRTRGAQRRDQAENRRGNQARRGGKSQRCGIDGDGIDARQVRRSHGDELRNADARQQHAERNSACGDHRAFGQHLAHQPPAARAKSRADGKLALLERRADQQQVGDVDAGDQQQKRGRAHQRQNRGPRLGDDALLHRLQTDVIIGGLFQPIFFAQIRGDAFRLGLRAFQRHPGPQTQNGAQPDAVALSLIVAKAPRVPYIRRALEVGVGRKQQFEAGLQNPDHHRAIRVAQRTPQHVGIRSEAPAPVFIADNRHHRRARRRRVRRSGRIRLRNRAVFLAKIAPPLNMRAEQTKNVRRHDGEAGLFERSVFGLNHPALSENHRRVFDSRRAGLQVLEIFIGIRAVVLMPRTQLHPSQRQTVRIFIGQRPQQHRVHHAENRRARADPQRDGENGRQGKRRCLTQTAKRVKKVLAHCGTL